MSEPLNLCTAEFLATLAPPTRIGILELRSARDRSAEIPSETRLAQPNLSQHLGVLRR